MVGCLLDPPNAVGFRVRGPCRAMECQGLGLSLPSVWQREQNGFRPYLGPVLYHDIDSIGGIALFGLQMETGNCAGWDRQRGEEQGVAAESR